MFKIFTDTGSSMTPEFIRKYDLTVLPLSYTVDGVEYPSPDATLEGKSFYDALRGGAVSHTSMVNMATFYEAFEKCLAQGFDILYVGLSSGISGTYQAGAMAAQELSELYPQRKILTVDTHAASFGEGLPVLYAAQMKDAGASLDVVAEKTSDYAAHICQYFTVEDLKYLKKGGRISGISALVGNILQIKPILTSDDEGHIILYRKERGWKHTLRALVKMYEELAVDKNAPVGISNGDNPESVEFVIQELRACGLKGEIHVVYFDAVTGAHVGPGSIAVFFSGIHR